MHATHHDVGHPVEDGADVAADGEQGVARVVDVERHTSAHRLHGTAPPSSVGDLSRVPSAMKPLVTIMASLTEYPSSQT